jgi:hypothetical protein
MRVSPYDSYPPCVNPEQHDYILSTIKNWPLNMAFWCACNDSSSYTFPQPLPKNVLSSRTGASDKYLLNGVTRKRYTIEAIELFSWDLVGKKRIYPFKQASISMMGLDTESGSY